MNIQFQRNFSKEADKSTIGFIRIHNRKLKELGGRNAWVCIEVGTKKIFRMIRGSGNIQDFNQQLIECDYETALELEIKESDPTCPGSNICSVNLRKANFIEKFFAHWRHPDPFYNFPLKISIVSLALGISGFFLGIISLTK